MFLFWRNEVTGITRFFSYIYIETYENYYKRQKKFKLF